VLPVLPAAFVVLLVRHDSVIFIASSIPPLISWPGFSRSLDFWNAVAALTEESFMPFSPDQFSDRLLSLIPVWLSLSVHEWAHARTAWQLGDDTAARLGRMTMNPLAHIDPIGTLLLPLLGVPFGWAKPVPVQPQRFDQRWSMRTGMLLVAIAGPLSNLALTAIGILVVGVLAHFPELAARAGTGVFRFLQSMILVNVILATFNALPIPPLDGSRVADALMPEPLRPAWDGLRRLGPLALAAVIILPSLTGIHLFAWPLYITQCVLEQVIMFCAR
jgi:Zn-dependent protease